MVYFEPLTMQANGLHNVVHDAVHRMHLCDLAIEINLKMIFFSDFIGV